MALSTFEAVVITIAVLGSIHTFIIILQDIDDNNRNNNAVLSKYAKQIFFQENKINKTLKSPYYH